MALLTDDRRPTLARVGGALAALLVVVAVSVPRVASASGVGLGAPVPDFVLPDWNGRLRTGREFRGKIVVIDFWASWCAPCATALPALDALARDPRRGDLVILAIDIDAAHVMGERFVAERLAQPSAILLQDPGGKLLARFGAEGMPALYLVDRDGIVRRVEAGYAPERIEAIAHSVDALLAAGHPPLAGDAPAVPPAPDAASSPDARRP